MAASTRSSLIPRAAIRSRTIRSRWWPKSLMGSACSWARSWSLVAQAQRGQAVAQRPEALQAGVVGEIEVQRRHRDATGNDRLVVGAARPLPLRRAGDPVVLPPARVELLDHRLLVDPAAEAGEADLLERPGRHVDVEQQVFRQLISRQP